MSFLIASLNVELTFRLTMFVILSQSIMSTADDSLPDHGIQYQVIKLISLPIIQISPP